MIPNIQTPNIATHEIKKSKKPNSPPQITNPAVMISIESDSDEIQKTQ